MRSPLTAAARCRPLFHAGLWLGLAVSTLPAVHAGADEPLVVQLQSGRTFSGRLDARTDEQLLWLRSGSGAIEVRRPIDWRSIVSASFHGQAIALDQLRMQAPELSQPTAALHSASETTPGLSVAAEPITPGVWQVPPPRDETMPAVRTLSIDATLSNWDADVEADGIELRIYPQTPDGTVLPVTATLHVDLLGDDRGFLHDGKPMSRLGRWSRQVSLHDFDGHGAVYRLPFQAIHPEFDLEVNPYALLNVRLVVPGVGTLSASQTDLRIRPYSIVRERVQQITGQRFFPGEPTSRGKSTQVQLRP